METLNSSNHSATPSGIFVTLLMVAFILLGGTWWIRQFPGKGEPHQAVIKKNERHAYKNLQRIVKAQQTYFHKSAILFGTHRYAAFLTHLWVAVDPSGQPVAMDLIPEKLAVAIGPSKSKDGYYFIDVRQRSALSGKVSESINYENQWTVAAMPQQAGRTGNLVFMADQTGSIYAKSVQMFSSRYPLDPYTEGWTAMPTPSDLKSYQQATQSRSQR
jgi:hypothetical protein